MIRKTGVKLHLNQAATVEKLQQGGYDEVILASGVKPRLPDFPGIDDERVINYQELLEKELTLGNRIAIIGAGGIGFDVAEYLSTDLQASPSLNVDLFLEEWGIDKSLQARGGISGVQAKPPAPERQIYLCQRKTSKHGAGLGKTTGWIHRTTLKHKKVTMLGGVHYESFDGQGLHIIIDNEKRTLEVDHVVLCSGQSSVRDLESGLKAASIKVHVIGGADIAAEIDAKRAIRQGSLVAAEL